MSGRITQLLDENRCLALMISLILLLVLGPTLEGSRWEWFVTFAHSVIGLAALVALTYRRSAFVAGVILGAPYFLALWLHTLTTWSAWNMLHVVSGMAFFIYALVAVLSHVLRSHHVSRDDLFGVACAYLLMGLAWCFLFVLLAHLHPGSFEIDEPTVLDMVYFSFTTLTTLGYGDITPVTPIAKSLAILEAVTGVLFVAMVVARLVAMRQDERPRA